MDPNETLKRLREMANAEDLDGEWTAETANERCLEYAELITALTDWIDRGGFLPPGDVTENHRKGGN